MPRFLMSILLLWLTLSFTAKAWAIDAEDLLPPDEAFRFNAEIGGTDKLLLTWEIAEGYYLYRKKFKFVSLTPDVQIGEPIFPAGESKQDQNFGSVEVYRSELSAELPIRRQPTIATKLELKVTFQGCADIGVCYMPIQKVVTFDLPASVVSNQSAMPPPRQSGYELKLNDDRKQFADVGQVNRVGFWLAFESRH